MIPRTVFSEEHVLFRDQVRRFVERELAPRHAAWEEAGVVPREAWLKAGAAGLLCCNIPEEYGGMGGDFLHSAIVIEEMSRAGITGPAFSLHSDIVAPYLLHYGTEAQKRQWLPRMARGEALAAVAMTEPQGGSDLQAIRTTALRDGDEYVIKGQKIYITNAQGADVIVVAAKTDPTARAKGISLILVETDRSGFSRGKPLKKVGCKAMDTSELFLDEVRVPASSLLGEEGRGFFQLMAELAQERLVLDSETYEILADLEPGPGVLHMEFTPRGEQLWLSVRDANEIQVWDPYRLELIKRLPADSPSGIFFTSRAHKTGL